MEKKSEKNHADGWVGDLPIQAENLAFKPEEMIFCQKCERKNPPTRLACFYCGEQFEFSETQSGFIKPNLRKLENWEKGFNLIYSPGPQIFDDAKLSENAKILKCEKEFLQKMIGVQKYLPLARTESEKEAEIVQTRLRELGAETLIVSDESLNIEKSARRLRGIEFYDGKIILILFNQNEIVEISNNDLVLIVTGAIFERKIEATEKRVKKADSKIVQTSETSSDEFLIDIYSRENMTGYRIFAKGFDFSCLEAEKEILAAKNLKKLVLKLISAAPEAKFVDDYLRLRQSLGNVWQVEEKTDSQGMKREGFGKFNLGNVTTINNLSQFTKYSRLQWQLL
jgi:hypothetical protein